MTSQASFEWFLGALQDRLLSMIYETVNADLNAHKYHLKAVLPSICVEIRRQAASVCQWFSVTLPDMANHAGLSVWK
jgi:hypothetical protein